MANKTKVINASPYRVGIANSIGIHPVLNPTGAQAQ